MLEEVATVIRSLKVKKSVGENDISIKLLNYGSLILSSFISNLFNCCVVQGEFPNVLKIAEAMPIYKKGDPNLCTNNKPISLLSPFSKIIEKLIFVRICSYLEKYDMLNNQQFGFRKNTSTTQTISNHKKII